MDTVNQWNEVAANATDAVDEAARRTAELTNKVARSKPARTMRDASNRVEDAVSDESANAVWRSVWLSAAGAAVLASIGLLAANRKHEALFVGQWVPTLAIVALWGQVVKAQ